ncbi:C-C chemokine receptor type 1-like [Littorina saxatilis]|uniref:C-C chemokine receptor type 1-like n=1 Tax=Littorina saxatilis TaxID=31220 RepID=UPI0038B593E0
MLPVVPGLGIIGNVLSLCVLMSSRKSRSSTYTNMATALELSATFGLCLGIIGNVLSLCVLLSPRMPRSSTYIYMATLAVTDSLVQVTNILFLVSKFPGHEVMVKGTCGLIFFLLYFSLHSNVVVMITMTAERYLAIR